jgi:hypothetical protein
MNEVTGLHVKSFKLITGCFLFVFGLLCYIYIYILFSTGPVE